MISLIFEYTPHRTKNSFTAVLSFPVQCMFMREEGRDCFAEINPLHKRTSHMQILFDYSNMVVFTGDNYVNIHRMTVEQAEYNRYAPILMTTRTPIRNCAGRSAKR